MGTLTADAIILKARRIFQDDTGVRWQDAEELDWLNDGQREIVLIRPDANVVNATVLLSVGTKQTIPAAGVTLIDVVRNMVGAGQATAGKVVRLVDREVLDATNPDWHSQAASANGEVDHYVFDKRDPKTFYVYPQPPATPNGIELVYSAAPDVVAFVNDTIKIDDIYANALLDYMLYRSYSKDADYSGNVNRAAAHFQAFLQSLGMKAQTDAVNDPNNVAVPNRNTVAGR